MLILTRNIGESIIATLPDGRTIAVKIWLIRGSSVRLAIDAPEDVRILRSELVAKENTPGG